MTETRRLFTLFINILLINALTLGGGYVIVPLLRKRFTQKLKWLSEDDAADIVSAAMAAPGAIAVNTSLLVGLRTCGKRGAFVSVFAAVIPSFAFIYLVFYGYYFIADSPGAVKFFSGARIGVAVIVAYAAYGLVRLAIKEKTAYNTIITAAVFSLCFIAGMNIYVIILSGFAYAAARHCILSITGKRL